MPKTDCDVLVVGGGPVGLAMACELLRHGVSCRLIDARAEPQPWSKAAAISARTMEIFQDMGIVERALERGRPVYGANVYAGTERIAHVAIQVQGTPYSYIFGLEQRRTELMLAERFSELGGRFEREVELVSLEQSDDAASATLRHAGGRQEQVLARWLIGCDGAHSTVRHQLSLEFAGSTFEQTLIQADIRVELPFEVDPNEGVLFLSPDGPIGCLPLLEDGRYRLIAIGIDDPPAEPPLSLFEQLVARRCPEGTRVSDPNWTVSFRFHGRVASRYRVGRVFLAGDAAHIHSPAGGQGMNLGIQDAYNLAWKLALVIRGRGRPELLDSYEIERRPVGEATVRGTDRATRTGLRMMTLRSRVAQALRNQAVSLLTSIGFFQQRLFQTLGQVEVGYGGSPIVGEHHSSVWTAEVGGRPTERPSIGAWYNFSKGPAPGDRVDDLDLEPGPGSPETLLELLAGTKHVLLLFDGAAPTEEGYENLASIADAVRRQHGAQVDVHIVVPTAQRPERLRAEPSVLFDADSALHRHFGCATEGLYLIRPDGHVGFRCQPAERDRLISYLATILVEATGDSSS